MHIRSSALAALVLACTFAAAPAAVSQSYTLQTLASFNSTDYPASGLSIDSSGNLFGTTEFGGNYPSNSGGGTVFEVKSGSNAITTLASFPNPNGVTALAAGGYPYGATLDSAGNLYGTTLEGGTVGSGIVYEVAKNSGVVTSLASFPSGSNDPNNPPYGGVTLDSSGNIFGTTQYGGTNSLGTVFEVSQGSSTVTTLASFDGSRNGSMPDSGVVVDSSGNLFGTTYGGGASSAGTVFEIMKGSATITTLASFDNSNGYGPYGGVIMDSLGNLFGTTDTGGANGAGTIFELAKNSNAITTLYSFTGGADGANPLYSLIQDATGNLFGSTQNGGANNFGGTVFEIKSGSANLITLASFDSATGSPSGVVFDSHGNLFGTTNYGGTNNNGTVFELVNNASTAPEPSEVAMMALVALGLGTLIVRARKKNSHK